MTPQSAEVPQPEIATLAESMPKVHPRLRACCLRCPCLGRTALCIELGLKAARQLPQNCVFRGANSSNSIRHAWKTVLATKKWIWRFDLEDTI